GGLRLRLLQPGLFAPPNPQHGRGGGLRRTLGRGRGGGSSPRHREGGSLAGRAGAGPRALAGGGRLRPRRGPLRRRPSVHVVVVDPGGALPEAELEPDPTVEADVEARAEARGSSGHRVDPEVPPELALDPDPHPRAHGPRRLDAPQETEVEEG